MVATLALTQLLSAGIPLLDLDSRSDLQVVVDRQPGQYLGHPTTVLLPRGNEVLAVYPKGHGTGAILYKRSLDGGKTWSDRLPTPKSWETSKETPTIHRLIGPDGKARLIVWSGLSPARFSISENDGKSWSELKPAGTWGGIVVMGAVEPLRSGRGHYVAFFHDDGRFFRPDQKSPNGFRVFETITRDGGLTWCYPRAIFHRMDLDLCEPGVIRSPDGKRMAMLLRENSRGANSQIAFSDDDGRTWTEPRALPDSLNGDRHTPKYLKDGRIFMSFRGVSPKGKSEATDGDWVGWIGSFSDLEQGKSGQYRIRLKDNKTSWDSSYPGVEVLRDGTILTTTYGHWTAGEKPYILSVRVHPKELDRLAVSK